MFVLLFGVRKTVFKAESVKNFGLLKKKAAGRLAPIIIMIIMHKKYPC